LTTAEIGHDETSSGEWLMAGRLTGFGTAFLLPLCQSKNEPVPQMQMAGAGK
jgi:hypothetical protein